MNHQNKTSKNLFLSGSKIIRASSFAFIAAALVVSGFFAPQSAFAAATVYPATGGTDISIDTTFDGGSGTFTPLEGPVITESVAGDIAVGTHTITLPTGWKFDINQNITISKIIGNIVLGSTSVTPTETSFSFVVNGQSTSASILSFSNIQVVPTDTTAPSTGNMTHLGAGIVSVDGSTNFGTLSTVPGTVAQLVFATQPGGAEYGSLLNPQPVIKTQDQFGNDSTKDLASSLDVGLTLTNGTGVLVGDATLDIGTGAGNGTVIFTDLTVDEFGAGKQLTVAATGLTSAVSNNFEITKKPLTATLTANNKEYDGENSATITGVVLDGVLEGDVVAADFSAAAATFEDENAGTGKTVNATGITLTGGDKDN
ncbi:MAG: YDG domain-containing protein, partial [Pseudorhodobacter sp.]|nr:YDG domain-containing protein [Pseudorhodobacter sp.]